MIICVVRNRREFRQTPSGQGPAEVQAVLGWAPESRTRKRWGATTVELAVVAPVVFAIILGIFEIGRGLMVIHLLNNAAQAGCRAGIVEGQSTANIQAVVVNAAKATGINGDTVTVQVNDGSADASSAVVGDEITVKVKVPVSSVSWLAGPLFLTGSLQGQYTMRRE
jgi:Flp pilus assembly protein TadG